MVILFPKIRAAKSPCTEECTAYFFRFVGVLLLLIVISAIVKIRIDPDKSKTELRTQKGENGQVEFIKCPVCNTPLAKNENLHSRIFRPMNTPDQRMMVQGCPHCYPETHDGVKRVCPVCRASLSKDDELVARLFNRSDTKKHVMIVGCSICMKIKK